MAHIKIKTPILSFLLGISFVVTAAAADRPTHPDDLYQAPAQRTCKFINKDFRNTRVHLAKAKASLARLNTLIAKTVLPAERLLCNKNRAQYDVKLCRKANANLKAHQKVQRQMKQSVQLFKKAIAKLRFERKAKNCGSKHIKNP